MSVSLSSYTKDELPQVLHSLKQYKKMLKEMGKRASTYFFTDANKNFRAEYDPTMDIALVEAYVIAAFAKHFDIKLTKEDIRFFPHPDLVSGARIFA
jgi:hypothetical protein